MKTDRHWLHQKLVAFARTHGLKAAARQFGCSRTTARKWLRRHVPGKPSALAELSRRPRHCPPQTAAALEVARAPLVLVLAVDLPHLTPGVLEQVLAAAGENRGVVPRVAGRLEPLTALYSRSAAVLADAQLARQRFAVRDFAQVCAAADLVRFLDLPAECDGAFANWNTPEALAAAPPPRSEGTSPPPTSAGT